MLNLKNTLDGYLKNVEVIGNTIQDINNLANIRSVGDKVEGQELYEIPVLVRGKNLFNGKWERGYALNLDSSSPLYGKTQVGTNYSTTQDFIRVAPNETYYFTDTTAQRWVVYYDKDKNPISHDQRWSNCVTPNNTAYIKFYDLNTRVDAFPNYSISITNNVYEPYQENKLEILSPVQLEKVGDVADRIICKDGVWGVEKNIEHTVFNGNEEWYIETVSNDNYVKFKVQENRIKHDKPTLICNKFTYTDFSGSACIYNRSYNFYNLEVYIEKTELVSVDAKGFKLWLQNNNLIVNYITTQPQFIPLPHDQQVKLRTFAGQTNIAFLTEIAGQIKAQVPKSLGATVNTHTEQIADLHNSLDRVKKLEETTVSTIETESNFTTVDATNNGYFEDVKLEGKTLVNLATQPKNNGSINSMYATISTTVCKLAPSTEYTYIISNNGEELVDLYLNNHNCFPWTRIKVSPKDITIGKATTLNEINGDIWISLGVSQTVAQNLTVILLEGDHTNNPPSYFEGLVSVGQDVEEVSVLSVNNGNLAYNTSIEIGDITTKGENGTRTDRERTKGYIEVLPSSNIYTSPYPVNVYEYDSDYNFIRYAINVDNFKTSSNTKYIRCYQGVGYLSEIILTYSSNFKNQINKQDKKEILYFNPTTETWEKPILREWDTIEKHSDGKYYYHKRSNEIILNGREGWSSYIDLGNTARCYFTLNTAVGGSIGFNAICNKFIQSTDVNKDVESMWVTITNNRLGINILKSKLSTQDIAGFKAWLQANPTTVVYQLAQEEVYECTNIDLMTYSGETNYIVNSGAISPKSLLKVHNNISNVVKILQEKVSLLENTFIAGLKSVLSGDMYSLATILYPEDFEQNDNTEQDIMVIPE